MKKGLKWFAVKSVYIWIPSGKVRSKSAIKKPFSRMVEERILLFKAKNIDEAIKKAEKESKEYCSPSYINIFGEEVSILNSGSFNAFELSEEPGNAKEVFSSTEIIKSKEYLKDKLKYINTGKQVREEKKLRKRFQQAASAGSGGSLIFLVNG